MLISRGHSAKDVIENYGLRKLNALSEACDINMRLESKYYGIAARMGFNATSPEFNRWLEG